MPVNGMELGSDIQIVFTDSQQGQLTFNILTMLDVKQLTKQIRSTALSGKTLYADLPEGWTVDLDFDKAGSKLMDYIANNEQAYLSGFTIGQITMSAKIQDVGGGFSFYRFTGGTMKLNGGGAWRGLDKVTQKATITFSRILKSS
jgi:hypothetical protein